MIKLSTKRTFHHIMTTGATEKSLQSLVYVSIQATPNMHTHVIIHMIVQYGYWLLNRNMIPLQHLRVQSKSRHTSTFSNYVQSLRPHDIAEVCKSTDYYLHSPHHPWQNQLCAGNAYQSYSPGKARIAISLYFKQTHTTSPHTHKLPTACEASIISTYQLYVSER